MSSEENKPILTTYNYKEANAHQKGEIEVTLANYFYRNYRMYALHDNTIYIYDNDGIYHADGREIITRRIDEWLGGTGSRYMKLEILAKICDHMRAFKTADELLEKKGDAKYDICVENGILNILSGELKPFTPDEFFVSKLPVKYDPNAKCQEFEKFFEEISGNNKDIYNQLIEIFGWCLIPRYYPHGAVALVGQGQNGKTTYLNVLKAWLGLHNFTTVSLHELEEEPFSRGELHGKMANIYDELDRKAIMYTGMFKMLTGESSITADFKFRNRITFGNVAKFIFAANILPQFKSEDDSDALYRRWIIIHFTQIFSKQNGKEDTHRLEKLCNATEFSGILNLAIVGAQRLLNETRFTSDNITIEEKRQRFLSISDAVPLFIDKIMIEKENNIMTRRDLFLAFKAYLEITGSAFMHQRVTQTKFSRDLLSLIKYHPDKYNWIQKTKKAYGTSVIDVWYGIDIDTKDEKFSEIYYNSVNEADTEEMIEEDSQRQESHSTPTTDKDAQDIFK